LTGDYLSAVVPMPGDPYENVLAIIDVRSSKLIYSFPSGHRDQIHDYAWVGDRRVVASLSTREGFLDTPVPTGELIATDIDGQHGTYLFGWRGNSSNDTNLRRAGGERRNAAATIIDADLLDGHEILIAARDYTSSRKGAIPSIERLNVDTGHTRRVDTSPVTDASFVADHDGQVRTALGTGDFLGMRLWARGPGQDDKDWWLLNDSEKSRINVQPIGFNRDNSRIYVRVSHAQGPDSIELMNPANGERTLVYRGDFADPGPLLPTADGKDFYAVVTREGIPDLHYIDPSCPEAMMTKALASKFPGQRVALVSFTRNGKTAVLSVSSDRNPGDYFLFDFDTRNARYVLSRRRWIEPAHMRPMQPITLQARDGLTLHGFLTEPEGSRPYPLVVLPHGGPHGIADDWGYDSETQMLASRGYAVLQVNYRGSGGYGQDFQQKGYRQWGLSMQDDLTDATRWAITQGYADARRTCIYGTSYGGYAAIEGAVREPELYRCAIGYAGIYDLRIQWEKSDTQRSNTGTSYLTTVLGTDRDDLLRRSPLSGIDRIHARILLIHGGADQRVPFANFREFTHALDKAGKKYESLTEPDEGHGFYLESHRLEANRKILDFLDQNIGSHASEQATTTRP
ncbi:S9 family peptidase, partial [Dyella sp.]|uniref:alpha/beta hydrolase family protein n=1 Tax=Dyella sp. TaxID=1869338 RepID=UPI002ED34BD4